MSGGNSVQHERKQYMFNKIVGSYIILHCIVCLLAIFLSYQIVYIESEYFSLFRKIEVIVVNWVLVLSTLTSIYLIISIFCKQIRVERGYLITALILITISLFFYILRGYWVLFIYRGGLF